MSKYDGESPWNPVKPASLTPVEYEKQVVAWLRTAGTTLERFDVKHLEHLQGSGGDYEFDAIAEFTILNGAKVVVVVECKRYSQPVEREKLLALWAKLQDVKAHKAMIFATCGFQSGALEYAEAYGIATIVFVDGSFLYEIRAPGLSRRPIIPLNAPEFAGILVGREDGKLSYSIVDSRHPETLADWLKT